MSAKLKSKAQRVQDALESFEIALQVVELEESTRSAQEAADSIGCQVEQIAKSIVFKSADSGQPLLVIASGPNRIDVKKLKKITGETFKKADAAFVRDVLGFAIGGVPPVGHSVPVKTMLDATIFDFKEIWAAAGTPNAVFKLTPEQLKTITRGQVVNII